MRRKPKLGELLLRAGVLTDWQIGAALHEQQKSGLPLGKALVRLGMVEEGTLIRALAAQLELPSVRLADRRIDPEVIEMLPAGLAEKYRCLPLLVTGVGASRVLHLAMEDPADLDGVDDLSFRLGMQVQSVLVAPSELDAALRRHYTWGRAPGEAAPALAEEEEARPVIGPADLIRFEARTAAANPAEKVAASGVVDATLDGQAGAVLRALVQILAEKGLVSREELLARLRS